MLIGPVAISIVAALAYGAADFLGGVASKRAATLTVTLFSQFAGLLTAVLLASFIPMHPNLRDLAWGAAAGVAGVAAIALLYRALSIGAMGVVSPITAVLASGIPVVFATLHGESLSITQILGIVLAMIAVITISASIDENGKREFMSEGVREAMIAGALFGVFFILLGNARPQAGLAPLVAARVASVLLQIVIVFFGRIDLRLHGAFRQVVLCGFLDMMANVLYVTAARNGNLAIAAVVTSLYPASTVLLAFVVLKERLNRIQMVGFALALVGVVLLLR